MLEQLIHEIDTIGDFIKYLSRLPQDAPIYVTLLHEELVTYIVDSKGTVYTMSTPADSASLIVDVKFSVLRKAQN